MTTTLWHLDARSGSHPLHLLYAPFIAVAIWRSAGNYRGKFAWRLLAKGSVLFVALEVAVGLALG